MLITSPRYRQKQKNNKRILIQITTTSGIYQTKNNIVQTDL